MSRSFISLFTGLLLASTAMAGPRDELLSGYAAAVRNSQPGFAGFSIERGKALHNQSFSGGKPDTRSCNVCHNQDIRTPGRTATGKAIEPMAASVSPARYTDAAKVEKWFKRNCTEVLGRECTAQEKGDWLSYVVAQ